MFDVVAESTEVSRIPFPALRGNNSNGNVLNV
jgi:hypothetical protein